ncbi:BamA/TamA family outer membrane protein [Sphingobacterium sp. UT-1RO-CII-1]|uniref:BamA/TamA family outer membrane protein n=1 Tax=Sphingobacterium sp. UT-1RO-CII-1 TaxID=2995225 RepID=UPI00227C47C1|nr:BamA/TamA family outer membrane protein [Sphingobacterium sp. UT-1RO-CII-1]MCY4780180.1 BamA/TamA family outer membrane protein [Sphingobacterium sp. UT-1RO-CII-1]
MRSYLIVFIFLVTVYYTNASQVTPTDTLNIQKKDSLTSITPLYDISDGFKDISRLIRGDKSPKVNKKRSGISILPNPNYNPSIGLQIGAKVVGGMYLGDKDNTSMSIFASAISYTTRGIIFGYIMHDTYTSKNKWNVKGGVMLAKMVGLDYGIGMGNKINPQNEDDQILNNPERNRYVNHFITYGLNERVYKKLAPGTFVGAGVFFEIKRKVKTLGDYEKTPLQLYSERYGYDPQNYNNNGLMFNIQYMTRDNPNSAYKGIYTDVVLRMGQKWMVGAQNYYQLITDFRKYFQLSQNRPNHVLALWYWGSYRLGGNMAYLDMPGTGKDTFARLGRGYTNGYFKGSSFAYTEAEYRFPILRNQFLSGVVFANIQTGNDRIGTKLFEQFQPAGGAGLRLLFNKATRTNLCIDYAVGKFGQKGLFLGLNEAF